MRNDLTTLESAIDQAYDRLRFSDSGTGRAFAKRVAAECSQTIEVVADFVKQDADGLLGQWSEGTVASYFELAALLLLATESESDELARLDDLIRQLEGILKSHAIQKAKAGAQALLESLILAIEDVGSKTSQRILAVLKQLSNAPESVIPLSGQESEQCEVKLAGAKIDSADQALLRHLLKKELYREVMSFLAQEQERTAAHQIGASLDLEYIPTPMVSFASRKGGVGKSMLVLATAAWYLTVVKPKPDPTVCIIDLDLSGPVWQHLLFAEGNQPLHFLNDLLSVEQGNQKGEFEFPDVSSDLIKPLLEKSTIDGLSLLSVADLPRTNRYLSVAIANNFESCFRFLTQLLAALHSLVDLVVIDNAPGFGSLPLLSHLMAASVPHGCSAIVSTPARPDLWGTLIELSDLFVQDRKFASESRPPLWIVNKADKQAHQFLSTEHKIVDVANEIGAYHTILPSRPLIERAVSSSDRQFSGYPLPLDRHLLAFGNIKSRWGEQPLQETFTTFLNTRFFKAFVKSVGERAMRPRLTGDPKREGSVSAIP